MPQNHDECKRLAINSAMKRVRPFNRNETRVDPVDIRNTETIWGLPARALHWISAALIIFLLGFGIYMTGFTERSASVRLPLYGFHAWAGIALLTLLVARLVWRFANLTPAPPANSTPLQRRAAAIAHGLLYLLIAVQCLLGWALAGTFPASALQQMSGLDTLPMIFVSTDRALHEGLETTHFAIAMTLLAFIVLHVAAALFHHIRLGNDVLVRMWSGEPQAKSARKRLRITDPGQ